LMVYCSSSGLPARQSDNEGRALAGNAPGRDRPTVPLDNLAADCQPHTSALVFRASVQPLEWGEDPVQVLLVKPDAVVLDGQLAVLLRQGVRPRRPALAVQPPGLNLDDRRLAR